MLVSATNLNQQPAHPLRQSNICMLQKSPARSETARAGAVNCCLAECSDSKRIAISFNHTVEFLPLGKTTRIPCSISYCQFFMKWRSHWLPLFHFEKKPAKNALVVKFKDSNNQTTYFAISCSTIARVQANDSNFCIPEDWHELSFRQTIKSAFEIQADNANADRIPTIAYVLDLAALYQTTPCQT